MSLSIMELITLWECCSIFLFIFQPFYRRTKMILLSRWAVLALIPRLPPSYFWHRIFSRSWETIYSLVSKPHFERRPNLVQSSPMVWHLTLDFLLVWIMAWIISCSSRTSLYIDTKSSGSTLLHMTCDAGPILSTRERLIATSCYWQIRQIVLVYTIFYTHESWVRIMQTWSILGLGCRTMRPTEKRDLDKRWAMQKHLTHTHTHTNLFLSQSSRGGGGIHLFQSRSDCLSLGRKSTRACSLKFQGTDSIGCRESGYNPRGSQSLSDAMQWDNQQSINQSISTQACNGTINRDFEDHVTLGSLRWEVQFDLSWGLILIYGTWQDSTGFYTNNGFLT